MCADLASNNANVSAVDCNVISGSASVMHVPTGLFVAGSYARYDDKNRVALYQNANPGLTGVKSEDTYWMVMAGIEQNWFGIGKTTLYGEYARHEVGAGLATVRSVLQRHPVARLAASSAPLAPASLFPAVVCRVAWAACPRLTSPSGVLASTRRSRRPPWTSTSPTGTSIRA